MSLRPPLPSCSGRTREILKTDTGSTAAGGPVPLHPSVLSSWAHSPRVAWLLCSLQERPVCQQILLALLLNCLQGLAVSRPLLCHPRSLSHVLLHYRGFSARLPTPSFSLALASQKKPEWKDHSSSPLPEVPRMFPPNVATLTSYTTVLPPLCPAPLPCLVLPLGVGITVPDAFCCLAPLPRLSAPPEDGPLSLCPRSLMTHDRLSVVDRHCCVRRLAASHPQAVA